MHSLIVNRADSCSAVSGVERVWAQFLEPHFLRFSGPCAHKGGRVASQLASLPFLEKVLDAQDAEDVALASYHLCSCIRTPISFSTESGQAVDSKNTHLELICGASGTVLLSLSEQLADSVSNLLHGQFFYSCMNADALCP